MENNSAYEELLRKLPKKVRRPFSLMDDTRARILFERLCEEVDKEVLKMEILKITKRISEISLSDIMDDLIMRFICEESEISPFKKRIQFKSGDYTFKEVGSYKEFTRLGDYFNNCLFGYRNYIKYSLDKHLIEVKKDNATVALFDIDFEAPGYCWLSDILEKDNKRSRYKKEIKEHVLAYLEKQNLQAKEGELLMVRPGRIEQRRVER